MNASSTTTRPAVLVSVFGTSTPFAYWGFAAVTETVRFLLDSDVHRVHCLSMEDFKRGLQDRSGQSVVFTSDIPDPEITELLLKYDLPVVAFFDDMEASVAYAMVSRSWDLREALRFSTQSFCALGPITHSRNKLIFRSNDLSSDVRDIMKRILEHLDGPADKDRIETLIERAGARFQLENRCTVSEHISQSTNFTTLAETALNESNEEQQIMIARVCKEYDPLLRADNVTQIELPREIFYRSPIGGERIDSIKLDGPARFLVFGPYFYIPAGAWTARVEFEVADNMSGNELVVDVAKGDDVIAVARTSLPVQGLLACELGFETTDIKAPIEVRLSIAKGAIEGRMSLKSVSLRKAESLPPESSPAA